MYSALVRYDAKALWSLEQEQFALAIQMLLTSVRIQEKGGGDDLGQVKQ